MAHASAASYLVWTLLSFFLCSFFIFHLWKFDRFQSFKWNNGSGTFKRVMVYTYALTIPLVFSCVLGFTAIKYSEGYLAVPGLGTVPTPYFLWNDPERRAIFPLLLMFSLGWSLEMITHLEELCFWLFLINATSIERSWFQSPYFKTWLIGSAVALLYMPLITIFTRADPLKNEAYCFLSGSLGSLSITIWFLPVLWAFPNFLNNLKSEGVDSATIVRLTKFSELNAIRVVFRFLFTLPLVILAIDGVRPHIHINENLFATDFLIMVSGIGCVVSSAITLVIFFPRSVEREIAVREGIKERKRSVRGVATGFGNIDSQIPMSSRHGHVQSDSNLIKQDEVARYVDGDWTDETSENPETLPPLRPNRKKDIDIELGRSPRLTENNLSRHNISIGNVNSMISNYTSPLDVASYSSAQEGRLTFTRR